MAFVNRNIGREIREQLIEHFGFTDDDQTPGQYRRAVDAQHQLVITDGSWHIGKDGGHSSAGLDFLVARRDINELWMELLNPDIGPFGSRSQSLVIGNGSWFVIVRV